MTLMVNNARTGIVKKLFTPAWIAPNATIPTVWDAGKGQIFSTTYPQGTVRNMTVFECLDVFGLLLFKLSNWGLTAVYPCK